MIQRRVPAAAIVSLALFCSSCVPPKAVKKSGSSSSGAESEGGSEGTQVSAPGVDVTEASLRGKDFSPVPDLEIIHFEYDKYSLDPAAKAALGANAAYLKSHPGLDVLVEGHCDQRGTTSYNLALGQKRAKEVRDYYIRLGVPGRSVATISYGMERPACAESTEECWLKNRRAETKVRSRSPSPEPRKKAVP